MTGDGVLDYLYASSGQGCGSCHLQWVMVFNGTEVILDDDDYTDVLLVMPDNASFTIIENQLFPGDSFAGATGRIACTFRYNGSRFGFVSEERWRLPTPTPPPAAPYRAGIFGVVNTLVAANTAAIDACVLGTTVLCASGLQAGEAKVSEARTSFYRLKPPPPCASRSRT